MTTGRAERQRGRGGGKETRELTWICTGIRINEVENHSSYSSRQYDTLIRANANISKLTTKVIGSDLLGTMNLVINF